MIINNLYLQNKNWENQKNNQIIVPLYLNIYYLCTINILTIKE